MKMALTESDISLYVRKTVYKLLKLRCTHWCIFNAKSIHIFFFKFLFILFNIMFMVPEYVPDLPTHWKNLESVNSKQRYLKSGLTLCHFKQGESCFLGVYCSCRGAGRGGGGVSSIIKHGTDVPLE